MKIRKDFVTNSSSSSFILTISFDLADGEEVTFNGNGGTPECGRSDYFDCEALVKVSPKELGLAKTVDELVELLINGVIDDCSWDGGEGVKIFENSNPQHSDVYEDGIYDAYDFILEIREKIKSMDDIEFISIVGNEYNYVNYGRAYTYDRTTGEYRGFIDGCEFEKDGSSGGDLVFDTSDCDIQYGDIEDEDY